DPMRDVLGSLASMVTVTAGYETAVAAAFGDLAEAVVVTDNDAAVEAIGVLRTHELGRSGLVLSNAPDAGHRWPQLPDYARYLSDVVSAPEAMRHALHRMLYMTAVVEDLLAARRLIDEMPQVVAVTVNGDVLSSYFARGGSAEQSELETRAALDDTEQ